MVGARAFDVRRVTDGRLVIDHAARPVKFFAIYSAGFTGRQQLVDACSCEAGLTDQHGLCIVGGHRHTPDTVRENSQQYGQGQRHDHERDQYFYERVAATALPRTHRPRPQ